jgi:hypothetical protein
MGRPLGRPFSVQGRLIPARRFWCELFRCSWGSVAARLPAASMKTRLTTARDQPEKPIRITIRITSTIRSTSTITSTITITITIRIGIGRNPRGSGMRPASLATRGVLVVVGLGRYS